MMELIVLTSMLSFLLGLTGGLAFYQKEIIMAPLTKKGEKVKKALVKEYGKKKGESVLYAMENKGTAKGLVKKAKKKTTKKK